MEDDQLHDKSLLYHMDLSDLELQNTKFIVNKTIISTISYNEPYTDNKSFVYTYMHNIISMVVLISRDPYEKLYGLHFCASCNCKTN